MELFASISSLERCVLFVQLIIDLKIVLGVTLAAKTLVSMSMKSLG